MQEVKEPLCHLFDDLLEPGLMEKLDLDRETYTPAFTRLRDYWMQVLPVHGQEYVMCAALQLRDVLKTPGDWEEVGRYLADATAKTYYNGSHQFVGEAVPALVDSRLARTKDKLIQGIDVLLKTINSKSPNGTTYDGGKVFSRVAAQMRNGELTSFNDIRIAYPPLDR